MKAYGEVKLLEATRYSDDRGFLEVIYSPEALNSLFSNFKIKQVNRSYSKYQFTVRGLHFQYPPFAQGKLIRCTKGSIFDVAVDIRMGSPNFGCWSAYKLKADDKQSIFIPIGFAHGFMTLEKDTEVIYQCDNEYSMSSEGMIKWNDADIGIDWPNEFASKISEKDKNAKALSDIHTPFSYGVQ